MVESEGRGVRGRVRLCGVESEGRGVGHRGKDIRQVSEGSLRRVFEVGCYGYPRLPTGLAVSWDVNGVSGTRLPSEKRSGPRIHIYQ